MKRIAIIVLTTSLMLVALFGGSSSVSAREALFVKIGKQAALHDSGRTVEVTMKVRCSTGYEVLEAFVYVVQEGSESQFGSIPVTCDDKLHRHTVRLSAYEDSPFQSGEAQVSAYILLYNPTIQLTQSASPVQLVKLR